MKKFLPLLLIVILLASACSKIDYSKTSSIEDTNLQKSESKPEIASLDKNTTLGKSENNNSINECEKLIEADAINACYWNDAITKKNAAICKFLPKLENQVVSFEPESYNYFFQETCENELNYTYGNAQWNLKEGLPPYGETLTIYEGNAELIGWFIEDDLFTDYFHITSDSIKFLPPSMQRYIDYQLKTVDENGKYTTESQLIEQLKKYSEKSPAKIKVRAVMSSLRMGLPTLVVENIVD